jgi:hypothetical protein
MQRHWEENRHAHQPRVIWRFIVQCARVFGCIAGMQYPGRRTRLARLPASTCGGHVSACRNVVEPAPDDRARTGGQSGFAELQAKKEGREKSRAL